MKLCIVTNYKKTLNYGAVLQAYALNKYLRMNGVECYTLNYSPRNTKADYVKAFKRRPLLIIKYIIDRILKLYIKKHIIGRELRFREFKNEYIPHTDECDQFSVLDIESGFDILLCGSDQIWRPGFFNGQFDDVNWLKKSPDGLVKVSYAASLGIDFLNDEMKEYARKVLSGYKAVSVREESGKELLKFLYPKHIEVVVDPVFLLGRENWNKLLVQSDIDKYINNNKYVFVYFINPNHKAYIQIKRYARENKLQIISFPFMSYKFNINDACFSDVKVYDASPRDFINFIRNASVVITDSFHATAFSIIYNKEFFTYITNHGSRLYNLLDMCNLQNRILTICAPIKSIPITDNQWNGCTNALKVRINDSRQFLEDELKIEKNRGLKIEGF